MPTMRQIPSDTSLDGAVLPPVSAILMQIVRIVLRWEMRRLTRKGLRRLDDHLLRDIGLDPIAAADEAAKPFWRD